MTHSLLVIEDDIVHGAVIRLVAEKAGFTVQVAPSIASAVECLRVGEFDCVSLDLSLGELSGFEAMQALDLLDCRMPIIIISGATDHRCGEAVALGKALNLNVCPPLAKPVEFGALRNMLLAVAERSPASTPSASLAV